MLQNASEPVFLLAFAYTYRRYGGYGRVMSLILNEIHASVTVKLSKNYGFNDVFSHAG